MAAALHFTLPPDGLNAAFDSWDLALASRGQGKQGADGGPMRLDIVNAAWAEKTYTFSTDYLDVLATDYGAGIKLLDFVNASASARTAINNWVADQTYQKIQNLLPPGSVDPSTRLVLTNAVYLDAAWLRPFDTAQTGSQSFARLDNSTVTTMFMGVDLSNVPALQGTGYARRCPCPTRTDNLSTLLVVPDRGTFYVVRGLLSMLPSSTRLWPAWPSQQVVLSMPTVPDRRPARISWPCCRAWACTPPSSAGQADFSGMDGTHNLYISNVIHKAFINVAEKGTEAAAATATVMNTRAVPSGLYVHIDRPFLYFLRDQPTGAILFMGRVADPSQS